MEKLSISKERYFAYQTLEVGQLAKAIEGIFEKYDTKKSAFINIDRNLPDGSHAQNSEADLSQLEQICTFKDLKISIHFMYSELNDIYFRGSYNDFSIEVDATGARIIQDVFDNLIGSLNLTEIHSSLDSLLNNIPPGLGIPELKRRIENLERAVFGPDRRMQCFLSYRFNDENEAVAQKVKKFLNMLDVDVVTGEVYEPRKIGDKILSKLQGSLDMVVLLVASDGESMWTRDEINTALQRGLYFIPIVEQGAHFTPGLFGDIEWIPFEKGHVSDAFIKILEAIQYIRRRRVEEKMSSTRAK